MKNVGWFLLTCIISTFAFFGALAAKNPFPCFAVAFGSWVLFFWSVFRRNKRDAERRYREHLFNEFMRSKTRGQIRR